MGWRDREWSRDERDGRAFDPASAVTWIIVANVVCYFAEILFLSSIDPTTARALALCPADVARRGHVWQLVTSMFLHSPDDPWHVTINMLVLGMFGPPTEQRVGTRAFLGFYFAAGIAGGLAFVGVGLLTRPFVPAIGASGAVMGVVVYYTFLHPWETINIYGMFRARVVLVTTVWVGFEVMRFLKSPEGGEGVANSAHLGGALFGFLYYRFGDRVPGLLKKRTRRAPLKVDMMFVGLQFQVDALLRKKQEQGVESLTEAEKQFLQDAGDKLGKRLI